MQSIWLAASLAQLILAPAPCESLRCSCFERPSAEQAGLVADAVFLGTVERVVERVSGVDTGAVTDPGGVSYLEVHLQVEAAWKGVSAPMAIVTTGVGAGDCGFPFEPGRSYLVYAREVEVDGVLATSSCSRTALVDGADGDLAALGPPDRRP